MIRHRPMLFKNFRLFKLSLTGVLCIISVVCLAQEQEPEKPGSATDHSATIPLLPIDNVAADTVDIIQRARQITDAVSGTQRQASGPAAATARPLNRREQRRLRREERNRPLDVPELRREAFRVNAGLKDISRGDSTGKTIADSLGLTHEAIAAEINGMTSRRFAEWADSLSNEGILTPEAVEILRRQVVTDSLGIVSVSPETLAGITFSDIPVSPDSTFMMLETVAGDTVLRVSGETYEPDSVVLSNRERRQLLHAEWRADSTKFRHNPFIRDSIPISRVTAISFVVPGFAQFYNQDYWKIPVLYGLTGASLYFGIQQNRKYSSLRNIYDELMVQDKYNRERINPVQRQMIRHNTWRQLFFGAAIGSYIYFLGDGVMNYPANNTQVKIATTLSLICPGAGQVYNGSYWRGIIIAGGFASVLYVIDWNNRIYQYHRTRFRETKDNQYMVSRDSARRNRDLTIIIAGLIYVFNIMDAHVDAQLQDYDVGDDLSWNLSVRPTMGTTVTQTHGMTNSFGLNLCITF